MENAMLDGLLRAKKLGMDGKDGCFHRSGWDMAISGVRKATNQPVTREICDNRWRKFKSIWKLWNEHNSRVSKIWTWHGKWETYVTEEPASSEYFKVYPEMIRFRQYGPPYRDKLEELLDGGPVLGRYATSGGMDLLRDRALMDSLPKTRGPRLMSEEERDSHSPTPTSTPAPTPRPSPILVPDNDVTMSISMPTPSTRQPSGTYEHRSSSARRASSFNNPPLADIVAQLATAVRGSDPSNSPQLAESIAQLAAAVKESNASLRDCYRPPYERAVELFRQEQDRLLPEAWKVCGRFPLQRIVNVLRILQLPSMSETFLALGEYRAEWLFCELRLHSLA
jgi:hypothetical protein